MMKKKLVSLFLALALTLSLLPLAALAEGTESLPFTVSSGGNSLTEITTTENGYSYTPYGESEAQYADLYTVRVPFGTLSVTLTFQEDRIAYTYDKTGAYIGACAASGEYANYGQTGETTALVQADANGNLPDYVVVQTPYDSEWNSTTLYAVAFESVYDCAVSAGGTALTDIAVMKEGYTPYNYDENGDQQPGTPVSLYTVTVPDGTVTVDLQFTDNVLAYNYKDDGTYLAGEYADAKAGAKTASVKVDANGDGIPDFIQVQTPFDANWNTTVLYAVTFVYEGGGSGGSGGTEGGVTAPELRDNIAARYAKAGAAGDQNAPWITADMMAYENGFPSAASRLSDGQKQAMTDEAVDALAHASSPSTAAKYILSLAAMGCDPAQLTTAGGAALNAKDTLDALSFTDGTVSEAVGNIYTLPYVIIAYQQFDGADSDLAKLVTSATTQKESWLDTTWGVDGMTPFMLALSPYYQTNPDVKTALDSAAALVTAAQTENGAVSDNAASTGLAMAGFAALGVDPASVKHPESGKSLTEGLLSYAADTKDGFDNSFSTEQGFRGLIALAGAEKGLPYRLYDFSGQTLRPAAATGANVIFSIIPSDAEVVVTDTKGTTMDPLSAGAFVYDLPAGTYSYTASKSGYTAKSGTFTVSEADRDGHVQQTVSVSLARSSSSGGSSSTVRVTVQVLVHDPAVCNNALTYKTNASLFTSLIPAGSYTVTLERGVGTARDALVAALDANEISYTELSNGYFPTIGGYTEQTHGANSGWLYLVNGASATTAAKDITFNSNSTMTWYFTDDYTQDYGSEPWSGGSSSRSSGGSSNSTAHSGDAVTVTPTATVKDGAAAVSVSDKAVANAISTAEKNNANTIVIAPKVSGSPEAVSVELSADAARDIAQAADLTIETGLAALTIPAKSLQALAAGEKPVNISARAVDGGGTKLEIKSGDTPADALPAGVAVTLPAENVGPGSVLVIVDEAGNESLVKKSIAEDGVIAALLDGSCTVRAVDNAKPFDDVDGHWAKDAVAFASGHELFQGTGSRTFSPDTPMSRAMLATVLYRLEDAAYAGTNDFPDVPDGTWYADAVGWASSEGIVNGTGKGFSPDAAITREQLATMLCRYAGILGMDTDAAGSVTGFSDAEDIHSWAEEAMNWAVGSGLLSGKGDGVLDPTGQASRAEVAAVLQRMVGLMVG